MPVAGEGKIGAHRILAKVDGDVAKPISRCYGSRLGSWRGSTLVRPLDLRGIHIRILLRISLAPFKAPAGNDAARGAAGR